MNYSTATLKSVLASRGMRYADLARETGLALGTIENIASGSSPSRRGRSKIESCLGMIIWPETKIAPQPVPPAVATATAPSFANEPVSSPAPATSPDIPISPTKSNHV